MVQLYIRQACYLNVSHAIVYAAVMTLTPKNKLSFIPGPNAKVVQ